jgi:hypothetical protein
MSLQSVTGLSFDFPKIRPVEIELSELPLTSDAGLLPIAHFDEQIGWTRQFADALKDLRDAAAVDHSLLSMVRQRIFGILADYPDQNDHDTLRSDPVFKLLAGRLPTDKDLASQPTLSRFENAVSIADLWRLRAVFVDQFIASFNVPPRYLTLDVDAFDDPVHGHQQLSLFHGYYGNHQYLPIVFTCAETDAVVSIGLRHGTCAAFLGADDDLHYLIGRLRAVWPDVEIHLRGDGGFGVPVMFDVCQELQILYTFGIGQNLRVQKFGEAILAEAQQQYDQTGMPQRLFDRAWYQADSWPEPREMVIKAEVSALGTNRRAVITNRPGCQVSPQGIYDGYVERGESENRNKELKCDLQADRLSDHRFVANYFRLYLHAATLNILVRLRQTVTPAAPTAAELGIVTHLPDSALDEPARRQFFNRRRLWDPLRNGCASTWRTQLIKVAAEVITRARRVIIRLSASWPHLKTFQEVSRRIVELRSSSIPSG